MDMPQIPFEAYYEEYNKTVHVIAGCEPGSDTVILYFDHTDGNIKNDVYAAVTKAFDQPGITKIRVCRIDLSDSKG